MAKPAKQKILSSDVNRGRKRAPFASVIVALVLIVSCAIFVGIRNGWNRGNTDSGNPGQMQTIDTQPPETTDDKPSGHEVAPPPTISEVTPPPKTSAVKVNGVYIGAWFGGDEERISGYIDLCEKGKINTLVIDVKDDIGQITFSNSNEILSQTSYNIIPDIGKTVSRLKENGIYTIARLVCFKDPIWSKLNPGHAITDKYGNLWDDGKTPWLDPYDIATWEYIAATAVEAALVGFDEIQLDYVRFPTDGRIDLIDYGSLASEKTKAEVIGEFLEYVRTALAGTSALLSADAFGIISVSKGDFEDIGQDLDIMLQSVDYVCPMIYPSHFANKRQNGVGQIINGVLFEIPDLEPYEVVLNILKMYKSRLPEDESGALIRPYIQAFTADYLGAGYYQMYSEQEVVQQLQAVYDAGFDEWILWNNSGDPNLYRNVNSLISSENSAGSSSGTPAVNNA